MVYIVAQGSSIKFVSYDYLKKHRTAEYVIEAFNGERYT